MKRPERVSRKGKGEVTKTFFQPIVDSEGKEGFLEREENKDQRANGGNGSKSERRRKKRKGSLERGEQTPKLIMS